MPLSCRYHIYSYGSNSTTLLQGASLSAVLVSPLPLCLWLGSHMAARTVIDMMAIHRVYDHLFAAQTYSDRIELSNAGTSELDIPRFGFTYGETDLVTLLRLLRAAHLSKYCCCCDDDRTSSKLDATRACSVGRCLSCGCHPDGAVIADLGSGSGAGPRLEPHLQLQDGMSRIQSPGIS